MTILPNSIYRFSVIPIKLPVAFFTELEQKISQFIWKHKRPWIAKAVWERRTELEESTFPTSDYTTKLQPSRQCGTGANQKHRSTEQDRRPRNKPTHLCCCCRQVASVGSNSVRPHRRQPTRLCHPWDSPGKNTGVGCHFLLRCMKVKSESEVAQLCPMGTLFFTKEARIYNGSKTASSKNGAGKTGQLNVKEWN